MKKIEKTDMIQAKLDAKNEMNPREIQDGK